MYPDLDKMKASQSCRTSVLKSTENNLSANFKQFLKMASNSKYINLCIELSQNIKEFQLV